LIRRYVNRTDVENVPMIRVLRRNGCRIVARIMSFVRPEAARNGR
jgi:hypothetical protein